MNQPIEQPAVVFIDLTDSTHLYHEMGDTEARALTGRAIARWEAIVTEHCGKVIKRIGDELLCVFPEPAIATRAAMALQASLNEMDGGPQLHAKVGFHAGPVLEEAGDIYGDTVNLAARMVQHAHPREILTTRETVDRLPALHRLCTRLRERAAVKGIPGEIEIFEVVWEKADLTAASSHMTPRIVTTPARLRLCSGGHSLELDAGHPVARLGRQSHNDLVVIGDLVSRSHARIEHRCGRFVLIDESTNGTWVVPDIGSPSMVCRDEVLLNGGGVLGLGEMPSPEAHALVRYQIFHDPENPS